MVFLKETLQKKLSESWFYKNNCKNISKYYKRILIALLILCLLILLAFVIYYYFLSDKYKTKPIEIPKFNHTVPNLNQNHQLIIELLIAVDGTMKDFHKENLNTYILQLTSTASKVFSDASIGGYTILISVTNIIVLNKFRKISNGTAYDGGLLNDFCRVVAKSNYHYDAAMFISRDRICSGSCKAIGLARMRSICTYGACALVQDNGLQTAITIAHELGHILGMPHDNDERCKNVIKAGAHKSIMHTQMTYDMDPWTWSDCSRHYLYDLLEHEDGSCLEHTSIQSIGHYSNTRLAGEIYNLDQQCKLAYGSPQRHCNIQSECKRLWCTNPNNKNSTCHSNNFPWADGTPCKTKNNGNSYWCLKGECVPRVGYAPKIVNGGWSPWSAWSECSLACGGGIQTTIRECNNPVAKNGGKYCIGVGKKYRSCNTQNCPIGSRDPREEQCSKKNGLNLNITITGYGPHTKWVPMYTAPQKNKCVLHCHAQGTLISNIFHDKLIDGTPCSLDNFDKCVNGVCRPAGCDNQLNSIAKIDKCGVCEGNNKTCVDITGYFKVLDLYKTQPIYGNVYYPVTTIPKGASSIVIEQVAFPEDNYIVLKDDQGNWLLNGNLTVIPFHEINAYAGVLYDYNGSRSSVERVNTTYGRTLKKDLNVEILSYSRYNNRDKNANLMKYSYSIDKNKLNRLKKS